MTVTTDRRVTRRSSTGSTCSVEGRNAMSSSRSVPSRPLCALRARSRVGRHRHRLEHRHGSDDGFLAQGLDGRGDGALRADHEGHARQQLGEVDAQGDVVGRKVAGAERAQAHPPLAVDEERARAEATMRDAPAVQGGHEAPDLRQLLVVEVVELGQRDPLRLDVGDDRREGADLRDGHRAGGVDPGVGEQQTHEGAVLELGAQGHRGWAGEAAAEPDRSEQAPPGGEAEGVTVDDVDVDGPARGRAGIPPVAGGVAVDEPQALERHAGVEEHARHVDARRAGRHGPEAHPEGEAHEPPQQE